MHPAAPHVDGDFDGSRAEESVTGQPHQRIENRAAMVSLYFMHYNLGLVHQTLRVTPETEAGFQIMRDRFRKSSVS
jgi:DnaJ-domain-containing protein 1